jgi:hypothetical protein
LTFKTIQLYCLVEQTNQQGKPKMQPRYDVVVRDEQDTPHHYKVEDKFDAFFLHEKMIGLGYLCFVYENGIRIR